MKLPGWTINVILVIATVFGCALSLELLLRVAWNNPYAGTKTHVVELPLNAGGLNKTFNRSWLDQIIPEVNFRTSSRGYILPTSQYAHPDITIAFLGGSTTECSYVTENLRFPALVSHLLAERGVRANTINGGRSGNTTQDAINILINDLVTAPPDIVVLMEATNDLGVLSQDPVYRSRMATPVTAAKQAKWALQSASSHSSVIGFVREKATSILISQYEKVRPQEETVAINQLLPREVEERYVSRLRAFILIARTFGSRPVLMTQPLGPYKNSLTPDWSHNLQQDRFNVLIRQTAKQEGALVIDLASALTAVVKSNENWLDYLYDGMHATDRASRFYAETIVDTVIKKILVTHATQPVRQ